MNKHNHKIALLILSAGLLSVPLTSTGTTYAEATTDQQATVSMSSYASKYGYTYPAEWEKQQSVWLAWSGSPEQNIVSTEIIQALLPSTRVELVVKDKKTLNEASRFLTKYKVDTKKIKFHIYEGANIFIRDPGPLFLKKDDGSAMIADFNWNNYGVNTTRTAYSLERGGVDKYMAKKLGIETIKSSYVAEGGGLEVNGEGVLLTFKDTALQRNPGKSLAQIESEYLRMYGQKKVIWLERSPVQDRRTPDNQPLIGNYFGGGANGHIDEVARFISPNTVLVASYPKPTAKSHAIAKSDYLVYEEVAKTLENSTDTNGKPFTVIRVENPDLSLFWETSKVKKEDKHYTMHGIKPGETVYQVPAVSYMNFLISNNNVVAPKYWKPGMPDHVKKLDEDFKKVLQDAFPGYTIAQLNPLAVNFWGGGIHCITQQMPLFD